MKKFLSNKKLAADIFLIATILLISLSVFLFVFLNRTQGSWAVVYVDNKKVGEYSLDINGVYYLNGGTNVLVIEDGEAYVGEATCPGYQDCVEAGRKSYIGDTIICTPNGVMIEIVGEGQGVDI